jgi:hypothetical protein
MSIDFYENMYPKMKSPTSLIMDISDLRPGEIELEDELNQRYLLLKYYKHNK